MVEDLVSDRGTVAGSFHESDTLADRCTQYFRYYPGATAYDPPQEFPVSYPHLIVIVPNLAMVGLAYWLEQRRVKALGEKKKA